MLIVLPPWTLWISRRLKRLQLADSIRRVVVQSPQPTGSGLWERSRAVVAFERIRPPLAISKVSFSGRENIIAVVPATGTTAA